MFFYALAPGPLLSHAGRGWVDEDVRLRQLAEWTDEKVKGLISLGIALPFVVEWPLIALTTPLRLITASPHISHCFCCLW